MSADAGGAQPDLSPLRQLDRIEVRTNLASLLEEVSHPPALYRIMKVVEGLEGSWTQPEGAAPVTRLKFECFRGDDFLGSIGVGVHVVVLHVEGAFWSHPSTPERRAELLRAAGVDDPEG